MASNGIHLRADRVNDLSGSGSGCECSDDEIITNFNQTRCRRYNGSGATSAPNSSGKCDEQEAGPSGSASSSTKTAPNSCSTNKPGLSSDESSDVSSFEDLGFTAVASSVSAGASVNATICGGNGAIDAETWQIINQASFNDSQPTSPKGPTEGTSSAQTPCNVDGTSNSKSTASTPISPAPSAPPAPETPTGSDLGNPQPQQPPLPEIRYTSVDDDVAGDQSTPHSHSAQYQDNQTFQPHSSVEADAFNQSKNAMPKFKPNRKISRRRSDGIVYTSSSADTQHNFLDDDDDLNATEDMETDGDESSLLEKISQRRRPKRSCHKCGKTKGDIRKHIERFRKQLETTTNASETEIKQQLNEFLSFLESRSRNSIDDGIEGADDVQASDGVDSITDGVTYGDVDDAYDEYGFDDDTGIHVYGTNDEQTTAATTHQPRQFINIGDYETM